MSTRGKPLCGLGLRLAPVMAAAALIGTATAPGRGLGETLARPGGQALSGALVAERGAPAAFRPAGGGPTVPLEPGAVVSFDGTQPGPSAGVPPFRVDLGIGQRLSGRLGAVDGATVRLEGSSVGATVTLAREGVAAVLQRPGEVQVLHDDFESLDAGRWAQVGEPEVAAARHLVGERALRLPAGGASITCRLPEPVASGRLEVAFFDSGAIAAGQQCFVDLLFRGSGGPQPVRAVVGWADETLGVESPRGPALAVQRLLRKEGWHRLSVRFGAEHTEIALDGNELAYGRGPDGPLVEVRLATFTKGRAAAPEGLSAYLDDLRLIKLAEPVGSLEVDPSQDEVRLIHGDQVFGSVRSADESRVRLRVIDRDVALPWSEVSGLYLRRAPKAGRPVEGTLARLEWRAAPGNDPGDLDQVEGALTAVSDSALTVATPYAGTLAIPRDRMRRLRVLGRGTRIVLDPTAHHFGNEIAEADPAIDPPIPEGGELERPFDLETVPPGPAFVVLDLVYVVGEADGLRFSDEVRAGWLRTQVRLNGTAIDYVNRHITSDNQTRQRVRLAVPAGLLKPGPNRLRIEQKGRQNDPKDLDDLGVLGIALEFGAGGPAEPPPAKP